jgi:hypothetical protein
MSVSICIPVHTTRHHMLTDCVANVKSTTGLEPVVWEEKDNVAVARRNAAAALDTEYIIYLDTDAFPVEKDWHLAMLRTAEDRQADIVSPREVLCFPGETGPIEPCRLSEPVERKGTPNVAGMCLLVRRGRGVWDTNIGLTAGFLGPCVEDTDFAHSVVAGGGTHWAHPGVTVLHKDRGADSMAEWQRTDEFFCYELMSQYITAKWLFGIPDLFTDLGKLPAKNQRTLVDKYRVEDLANCFAPIHAKLPESQVPSFNQWLDDMVAQRRQDQRKRL